jgi:hypothetical protein
MSTYNRSWAQGGTAGFYGMFSANQENGYVYFVGATTTGGPLNRIINVNHSFTSINIIAPQNDMLSLYKAKVKATTEFSNPFSAFASFGSPITSSGNFVLPNNALPLVNVLVVGGGGSGGHTHCGAGGGGGNVVKLTAFQAVGTTGVTIGGGGGHNGVAGATYFGNVYAYGGGGGGDHGYNAYQSSVVGNGGGAPGHRGNSTPGAGNVQTASTGLGNAGSPIFVGGNRGGYSSGSDSQQSGGAGGGGAGAVGGDSNNSTYGVGGVGHQSDISGSTTWYSHGGSGGRANNNTPQSHGDSYTQYYGSGGRGAGYQNNAHQGGQQGIVIVRYYIP